MKMPCESKKMLRSKLHKIDDRGSAIVIVIIAMALIGILATTILWASYLNYRIKINDLKVKNSFYSAETVVEQIVAGIKSEVVSDSINEAYQDVLSNWDALGNDANRESYFITAYIAAVEKKLKVNTTHTEYDKTVLRDYIDDVFWTEGNSTGYIIEEEWKEDQHKFKTVDIANGNGSMTIQNIYVHFIDSNGYLSIINTDIAIDVPKLRFTQAGDIDRLYPYVLIGDKGIETEKDTTVTIKGSIYGGVDNDMNGGIQLEPRSRVVVEDASYIISGGDIVVGNETSWLDISGQGAELIVRNVTENSKGFQTNVYANGLALNGSHLDVSGRMYIANDLILSGIGSNVTLTGQYYGYGDTNETAGTPKIDKDGNTVKDNEGRIVEDNPAETSSAIVINGKNSTVNLSDLTTLQLAGHAYVSLPQDNATGSGLLLPHVLMGESISVKSNQIAYLVPPECVGTLNGTTIIGQNPVSFETWSEMLSDLSEYQSVGEGGQLENDFRIVNANRETSKLGGKMLSDYGIADITAADLSGVDTDNIAETITRLNAVAAERGIRFYMSDKEQVYLYLVMEKDDAAEYFRQYYNVNSNKVSLDNYFNQYVSGGIRLKGNTQGYTVVGNCMVSATDAENQIQTSEQGQNLVRLLASVESKPTEDDENNEGEEENSPAGEEGDYTEVSDNVEMITSEGKLEDPDNIRLSYANLLTYLLEEEPDIKESDVLFENLVVSKSDATRTGLEDYLDANGGKVEFETGDAASTLKAVFVKSSDGDCYEVKDSDLRLVVALGDVKITRNFQGLVIASGKITVEDGVTSIKQDKDGVYAVLQAQSTIEGDPNIPANFFGNGSGMIRGGYEDADVDESGNLNIDYSKIVRYENWIKK